jgi:probable rRNA maturation factor
MSVETEIEDPRWQAAGLAALAEAATDAVLRHVGLDPAAFGISLLGCDDARIFQLNSAFRNKQAPTNVLSWPSEERGAEGPGAAPEPPDPRDPELGDIAIAFDTCEREAAESGLRLADHATHLLVHGTLHLLGYDHIREEDADLMERIEVEILATLGVADPY